MFRRRRRDDDSDEPTGDEPVEAGLTDDAVERGAVADRTATATGSAAVASAAGPWDVTDAPDDEQPRLDLGSMLVPVPDGLEVRVEVQDDTVVAATFVDGDSLLQVHAFAAPRSAGIWDEVRTEIAETLQGNGSAQDAPGSFGTELAARVPEQGGLAPVRFIGVDGPRWFLRGMLTGPAATDPARAGRLESAFRGVVVNRGTEAMAPRDLLPLHLPREVEEADVPPAEARHLQLQERGPEITEIQ